MLYTKISHRIKALFLSAIFFSFFFVWDFVSVYIHIYMYTCMYVQECTCVYVCIDIFIRIVVSDGFQCQDETPDSEKSQTYLFWYVCVLYTRIYIYLYTCIYKYAHVYIEKLFRHIRVLYARMYWKYKYMRVCIYI